MFQASSSFFYLDLFFVSPMEKYFIDIRFSLILTFFSLYFFFLFLRLEGELQQPKFAIGNFVQ